MASFEVDMLIREISPGSEIYLVLIHNPIGESSACPFIESKLILYASKTTNPLAYLMHRCILESKWLLKMKCLRHLIITTLARLTGYY